MSLGIYLLIVVIATAGTSISPVSWTLLPLIYEPAQALGLTDHIWTIEELLRTPVLTRSGAF